MKILLPIVLLLVSFATGAQPPAGGDVDISSPRGNYTGAENIHWYMQETLDYNIWASEFDWDLYPFQCNEQNQALSCAGQPLPYDLPLFRSLGAAPVAVYMEVDEAIPFGWRYALKQVRDVNRAFARSGIRVRLFVAGIDSVDTGARYNNSVFTAYDTAWARRLEKTRASEADVIIIFMNPETVVEEAVDVAGLGSISPGFGIQVAVTADTDAMTLAHEIGHNLGLGHTADSTTALPLIENGVGMVDPISGCSTIMGSGSNARCFYPWFSSPDTLFEVRGQLVTFGSARANSVEAANELAWMLALGHEVDAELDVVSPTAANTPTKQLFRADSVNAASANTPDIPDLTRLRAIARQYRSSTPVRGVP